MLTLCFTKYVYKNKPEIFVYDVFDCTPKIIAKPS